MIYDVLSNPVDLFIQYPILIIIIASVMTVVAVIRFWSYRKMMREREGKVHVIIHRPLKDKEVWLKPEEDGSTLYVQHEQLPNKEKKTSGHPEWKFHVSKGAFHLDRKGKEVIDVIQDAGEAISWNYQEKTVEQPVWNRHEAWKFITTKLLHIRYHTEEKKIELPNITLLFTISIILSAVSVFMTIYMMWKLGIFSNPSSSTSHFILSMRMLMSLV